MLPEEDELSELNAVPYSDVFLQRISKGRW
jgi:hypothetical protein